MALRWSLLISLPALPPSAHLGKGQLQWATSPWREPHPVLRTLHSLTRHHFFMLLGSSISAVQCQNETFIAVSGLGSRNHLVLPADDQMCITGRYLGLWIFLSSPTPCAGHGWQAGVPSCSVCPSTPSGRGRVARAAPELHSVLTPQRGRCAMGGHLAPVPGSGPEPALSPHWENVLQ